MGKHKLKQINACTLNFRPSFLWPACVTLFPADRQNMRDRIMATYGIRSTGFRVRDTEYSQNMGSCRPFTAHEVILPGRRVAPQSCSTESIHRQLQNATTKRILRRTPSSTPHGRAAGILHFAGAHHSSSHSASHPQPAQTSQIFKSPSSNN